MCLKLVSVIMVVVFSITIVLLVFIPSKKSSGQEQNFKKDSISLHSLEALENQVKILEDEEKEQ